MQLCVKERLVELKVLPLLCTTTVAIIMCILYTLDQKQANQNYPKHEINGYRRPNILFIVADDLGYNDVGYHGSEIKTPNLDALAMSGVRLENYYVQPVCTPTRSQLLSGRYQIHTGLQHGVIWHMDTKGLPLDSKTMADKLSDAGYSTHIVGKWHLGYYKKEYLPTRRGFHSFFGFLNGHNDYFTYKTDYKKYRGYDLRDNEKPADVKKYSGTYSTKLFAEKVIDLFKKDDTGKPLFVYLPFQAVHGPLQVPAQYLRQYDFIESKKRRTYAAIVTCMDEAIGNITEALKDMGKWDNTLLIFSTDNGAVHQHGSNWPLRGFKGGLWEGGIRAVGFVHGQLLKENIRGTVSRELLHVTDWFPTLVNLAGGDFDGTKPLDGYNQWETISEGKPSKRDEILINIDPKCVAEGIRLFNDTFDTNIRAGLRQGQWKLITGVIEDNGAAYNRGSNWPLRGFKGGLWEGGIRAVGFVHGQLLKENIRGTVSRELFHVSDWFPTLVNLAGGDFDGTKPLDGYNQWETISEGKPSKRDEILINIDPKLVAEGIRLFNDTFDTNIRAGLRQGQWKLITGVIEEGGIGRKKDGTNHWLFNIRDDPNENRDLSFQYPERVRFMLTRLEYYQSTAVPVLNTKMDRNANPKRHGGFWGPWIE